MPYSKLSLPEPPADCKLERCILMAAYLKVSAGEAWQTTLGAWNAGLLKPLTSEELSTVVATAI